MQQFEVTLLVTLREEEKTADELRELMDEIIAQEVMIDGKEDLVVVKEVVEL